MARSRQRERDCHDPFERVAILRVRKVLRSQLGVSLLGFSIAFSIEMHAFLGGVSLKGVSYIPCSGWIGPHTLPCFLLRVRGSRFKV